MRRTLLVACVGLVLAGCATYAPTVPRGYTGATATLRESALQEDESKGQLFHLAEVDGQPVYSSYQLTRRNNEGRGLSLAFSFVQQTLPAAPVRLKIVGRHVTGAPIQAIGLGLSGDLLYVEKDVSFTPEAGGEYRVAGKLAPRASDVWIEEARSGRRLTP